MAPTVASSPSLDDFLWDIVVFKVEDRIFRVNKHAFVQQSPVFADMYLVGDSSSGEGRSDENPIVLEGYKADDFAALLRILYPTLKDVRAGQFNLDKNQWIGLLRLSRPWQMDEIRQLAIDTLSSDSFSLTAVEKVTLARDHKVANWLVEGLTSLAYDDGGFSPDALEEGVGLRTAFRITCIRAKTRPKGAPTFIFRNGSNHPTFPTASVICGMCDEPFLKVDFECESCSKRVADLYITSSEFWAANARSREGAIEIGIRLAILKCCLCHSRAITHGFACQRQSCPGNVPHGCSIWLSLGSFSTTSIPHSQEAVIREVFKDEIDNCVP